MKFGETVFAVIAAQIYLAHCAFEVWSGLSFLSLTDLTSTALCVNLFPMTSSNFKQLYHLGNTKLFLAFGLDSLL